MPKACRTCRHITNENICPICKGTEFSEDYTGVLIVLDPDNSILAEKLEVEEAGKYALKVR
ncbi:DNA-directed RNA polymerase subunit E'' [Candidatus Bathyarchaeota archaeon]|jgi:DNA-directed RNA polymerase subunit E"|nr:DNA-directed RNA polymerase subunit E'' [Candidatus Bathyarchaeota archaeon]